MQKINFLFVVLAGLIPMITGFIWYSKALFGNAWMKASGTTEEKMKGSNMAVILLVSLLFSMLVALFMMPVVIHQFGILSVLVKEPGINDPGSEIGRYIADFMGKYGSNFRTFKHGAFHGTLAALLFALPIIGITALFERRGFKYIAIHAGYWIVTLALVGGVICALA